MSIFKWNRVAWWERGQCGWADFHFLGWKVLKAEFALSKIASAGSRGWTLML